MKERQIAYENLVSILIDKQYSNIVLRGNKERNTALITQLVYGTLRNYDLLTNSYQKYLKDAPRERVQILLNMAVYEMFLLDKPVYATINEAVEISKTLKGSSYANFVNAILRKVTKQDLLTDNFAIKTSHPQWLINLWKAHYGNEITEKICLSNMKEPKLTVHVNSLVTTKEKLLADEHFQDSPIENCLIYKGNLLASEAYLNGEVYIQSASSQLAINALDVNESMRVLDMCAAPGSKTLQLAIKMKDQGIIVANDLYDFRVNLIKQNIKKYHLHNVHTCNYDATKIDQYLEHESFDAVVLDAPCSGLGTIRHKPEIKLNITSKDIDMIGELQKELLKQASIMLKKNGTLLYSTCTLDKKENEKQVSNFIKENPNFTLLDERTIFPYEYDSDGFYYAKLRKS